LIFKEILTADRKHLPNTSMEGNQGPEDLHSLCSEGYYSGLNPTYKYGGSQAKLKVCLLNNLRHTPGAPTKAITGTNSPQ